MSLLEVEGLTVQYGTVTAVRDLSLRVDEGEIVAIVGANGAGKSSTMASIAGLVTPVSGSIRYRGEEITGRAPEQLATRGLSLVPEGRHVFPHLTVRENLIVAQAARTGGGFDEKYDEILERFPALRRLERNAAGTLSGGEQQQLAVARALLTDPALVLFDEPSLGLAPVIVEQVLETCDALRRDGVTVLIVEQFARRAMALADRTYVLSGGRLVLEGTSDQLSGPGVLENAYLGHVDSAPVEQP